MYLAFLLLFCTNSAFGQCGICDCLRIDNDYILDCDGKQIDSLPQIDDLIRRRITKAYLRNNNISVLDEDILSRWFSLSYIDLTGNSELPCSEIMKIPSTVHVMFDCKRKGRCTHFLHHSTSCL